jgi:hypothetical protein
MTVEPEDTEKLCGSRHYVHGERRSDFAKYFEVASAAMCAQKRRGERDSPRLCTFKAFVKKLQVFAAAVVTVFSFQ